MKRWTYWDEPFQTEYFKVNEDRTKVKRKPYDSSNTEYCWYRESPRLALELSRNGTMALVFFEKSKTGWRVVFNDLQFFEEKHLKEILYVVNRLNVVCK